MVQTPITARLPRGSRGFAEHDETVADVDHLAVAGRRGRKTELSDRTERQYDRWLEHFKAWCRQRRYQPDVERALTDRTAEEFAEWLVVDTDERARYTPNSVRQALAALRYWALKLEIEPQPTLNAAYGVVIKYENDLIRKGVIESRRDLRIQPGDPVG